MGIESVDNYFACQDAVKNFCKMTSVNPLGLDVILTLGNCGHVASDKLVKEAKSKTFYPDCRMGEGMHYENLFISSPDSKGSATDELAKKGLVYKGIDSSGYSVRLTLTSEGTRLFIDAVSMLEDPRAYLNS